MTLEPTRRGFIRGLASLLVAAPAVIRTPGLLMPIKAPLMVGPIAEYGGNNQLIVFRKLFQEYVRNQIFPPDDELISLVAYGGSGRDARS